MYIFISTNKLWIIVCIGKLFFDELKIWKFNCEIAMEKFRKKKMSTDKCEAWTKFT